MQVVQSHLVTGLAIHSALELTKLSIQSSSVGSINLQDSHEPSSPLTSLLSVVCMSFH